MLQNLCKIKRVENIHYVWSLANNPEVRTQKKLNGGNVHKIISKIST